ncbi:hypothetical protein CO2235_MP70227 [Cupriavidus oxalaticus]|uniref:Uncharacterized protein n=1 Tax=Cupriavidus oxalaticus TaxID=96344 RepID=A0A375FWI1_9BURK|nr:hypothetical protein CO2235_U880014 [Cupriavidus oxalaticus]SPC23554.1 hypothetical protein CO2235_MP70227 [Cupriavidus oxalaticus]
MVWASQNISSSVEDDLANVIVRPFMAEHCH